MSQRNGIEAMGVRRGCSHGKRAVVTTSRALLFLTVVLAGCASAPLASSTVQPVTRACVGGVAPSTCDEAVRVAFAAVAGSGWTPTHVWVDSGVLCPRVDCLFDPTQNFPYPAPPHSGTWVANVEIAFAGTDKHAGLMIEHVGTNLVPTLIGYRAPLPGWCSGTCP